MEDLLKRQSDQLAQVVRLLTITRNIDIANTIETHKMLSDEDHIAKKLDDIHETIKNIESNITKNDIVDVSRDLDVKKLSEETSNSHLEALKKIQETLAQNNEYRNIANRAKDQPINKSWSDNLRDLKNTFSGIKKALTGGTVLKSTGQAIASSVSPRYKDRMQYIKSEKALGNKASDEKLKETYEKRSQLLQRNVANESFMQKTKGYLTEPEFIKGDTEESKQYIKEKQDVGAGLKETDSRYTLNEKVAKREAIAREKLAEEFKPDIAIPVKADSVTTEDNPITKVKAGIVNFIKENVKDLGKAVAQKAKSIPQMVTANLSTKESDIETARATKTYQDTQIDNDIKQTNILAEQLDVQKSILEKVDIISKAPTPPTPTSTGDGVGGPLETIADAATGAPKGKGKGKGTPKGKSKFGKFAGKAGSFLKGGIATVAGMAIEAGGQAITDGGNRDVGDVVSTVGSAAQGAGTGAMIGSALGPVGYAIGAGAGAVMGAAQGFSDSFGEGGLELINELRDKDAISYPVFGTTPTVEKWDVIEKLSPEKIQTLIGSNEFEGKDLEHLNQLLNAPTKPEAVTPEPTKVVTPEPTRAEAVTPEPTKVVTKEGVSVNQEGWDKSGDVTPEATRIEPTKVVTKEGVSVNQEGWDKSEAVTPSKINASAPLSEADSVYNKSAEISPTGNSAPVINNITAPTTNVNNSSSSTVMKNEVKNLEASVNRLFLERNKFR
jgi:hypothetical protein